MLPFPFDCLESRAIRPISLENGEMLFRQGDRSRGLYFLENGRINLERVTDAGALVVIHSAKAGETFAEASLFSRSYHCNAVAIGEASVIRVDGGSVLARFRSDGEFAANVARRFAEQIQSCRRRVELLAIRNAKERVFQALSDGLLQQDIKTFASQIGLTHEATYRALAELCRAGRITKSGRGKYFLQHS